MAADWQVISVKVIRQLHSANLSICVVRQRYSHLLTYVLLLLAQCCGTTVRFPYLLTYFTVKDTIQ